MASSFKYFYYAFVPPGTDDEIAYHIGLLHMGLRWERAIDVDNAQVDRIAEQLRIAAHTAHCRALEYRSASSQQFGREVAQTLAARTRMPGRTTLIRVDSGA